MAAGVQPWLSSIRKLHDDSFNVDWERHLATLNERLRLAGVDRLQTAISHFPPSWFNGDIEALKPGKWVLVVSLNPQLGPPEGYVVDHSPDAYWQFWRMHNKTFPLWGPFFNPLVRVAAISLGEEPPSSAEGYQDVATNRMVFVELCPYASSHFTLSWEQVVELADTDLGFARAADFVRILLEEAEPAVVLVNGNPSMWAFEARHRDRLQWGEVRYESSFKPGKRLHHWQGLYRVDGERRVPAVGFPFLSKARTHNAVVEYEQLGTSICEFLHAAGATQ